MTEILVSTAVLICLGVGALAVIFGGLLWIVLIASGGESRLEELRWRNRNRWKDKK